MGRLTARSAPLALAALLSLSAPALASDVVLVVSDEVAGESGIREALRELGVSRLGSVSPEQLEQGVGLVAVSERAGDEDCGGVIALDSWSRRLRAAEVAPADAALAELSLLELEAVCLDAPVSREQLQRLQLGLVEVHLELAARPGAESSFHIGQAAAAAGALHALGRDLALPGGLDPGTARFIEGYAEAGGEVTVVGGGPGGAIYLDGQRLDGAVSRPEGEHLVQVVSGGAVLAAARPYLPEGDVVIWGGTLVPGELRAEVEALAAAGTPGPLLSAVDQLVDAQLVVASVEPDGVRLYRPDGGIVTGGRGARAAAGGLDRPQGLGAAPRQRPVGTWAWTVGAGGAGGLSQLAYGPVDLAGPSAGIALWGRGVITGDWIGSLAVHPQARSELLPVNYEDHWLWRAQVPIRAGVRWGRPALGRITGDIGAEAVVVALGEYEDRQRLRAGLALAGGGSFPLAAGFAARIEGWAGGGPLWWYGGGVTAGFERSW